MPIIITNINNIIIQNKQTNKQSKNNKNYLIVQRAIVQCLHNNSVTHRQCHEEVVQCRLFVAPFRRGAQFFHFRVEFIGSERCHLFVVVVVVVIIIAIFL
jgi:hypothetical protein